MENAIVAQITKKELYDDYIALRSRGLSPVQILVDYQSELHDHGFSVLGLISVVVGIIAYVVIDSVMSKISGKYRGKHRQSQSVSGDLWIVSGGDSQPIKLPFWMAVRVIRNHGWGLAEVEPVHTPPTPLTRWEHLEIALGWRMR